MRGVLDSDGELPIIAANGTVHLLDREQSSVDRNFQLDSLTKT